MQLPKDAAQERMAVMTKRMGGVNGKNTFFLILYEFAGKPQFSKVSEDASPQKIRGCRYKVDNKLEPF